mmetsp:Transcript_31888/g.79965  ORF Transcript_31888/g.79965 Transcript_31888/m.79965 type:complete len:241 (-) Transcript_31888:51-773(-)
MRVTLSMVPYWLKRSSSASLVASSGCSPPTKMFCLSTPRPSGPLVEVAHSVTHLLPIFFHSRYASMASSRYTNFTNPHPLLLFVWWFFMIVTFSTGPNSAAASRSSADVKLRGSFATKSVVFTRARSTRSFRPMWGCPLVAANAASASSVVSNCTKAYERLSRSFRTRTFKTLPWQLNSDRRASSVASGARLATNRQAEGGPFEAAVCGPAFSGTWSSGGRLLGSIEVDTKGLKRDEKLI